MNNLHANRKTIRTVFQTFIALCAAAPVVISQTGLDSVTIPWVASTVAVILGVAAFVTRVMNTPRAEAFLSRFAPWLAARPPAAAVVAPPVPPAATPPAATLPSPPVPPALPPAPPAA